MIVTDAEAVEVRRVADGQCMNGGPVVTRELPLAAMRSDRELDFYANQRRLE
jgi:hypothetical protein